MPKTSLQKSLQICLSKLKKPSPVQFQIPPITSPSWIISRCKHPRTPSFTNDQIKPSDAATLSDVDRFLLENFSSLYLNGSDIEDDKDGHHHNETPTGFLFESPMFVDPPPGLRASHRFFVSPGLSNSLIEEARLSASTSDEVGSNSTIISAAEESITEVIKGATLPSGSIAVLTCSPNPYNDFRRSMEEMVESRLRHLHKVDWDFMEELLFCYLKLNDKKSYKYILGAFVDMIVILRRSSVHIPGKSRKIPTTRQRKMKIPTTGERNTKR